jgi:hypothetical protein
MGIINNILKTSLVQKHTRIRIYTRTRPWHVQCCVMGVKHGLYEEVMKVELQPAR